MHGFSRTALFLSPAIGAALATNAKARYLEFVSPGGSLQQTTDEALGGTGGSIRGLFDKGRVDAGSIKLAFDDWPGGRPA